MSILERIHSPADLKALPAGEIPELCAELRSFLVQSLSKTGGHLASNLGAVELTVAIDRVYNTERDRLVFDVGHQSYVHKLLTGRREAFSTLRQFGGIAGFPKPDESVHDAFVAGHASTSISVALGMARARTLMGENYDVIALIGDGALTGGLAYEGLSDAGQSGEPMVIVLNDNGMSINKNVGGMATLLSKQRVKPGYLHFKRFYRSTVGKAPGLYRVLHHIKEHVKDLVLPNNMFDLIIKASTVLSTAILIVTAILVIMGFVVPIDAVTQELATENAAYAAIPAIADVTSQKGIEGVWRGVFVYAAFQCVSVPAMIAASTELTHKGVKRASILGWLMNGGALAASGAMLLRWYPILCTIKSVGVDTVASIAARHIGDVMKLPNQSVVTLMGSGYTWLFVVYTILLFCAFVSTSVTLVYSMIQRFEGHCFPKAIKSKAVRSVIVGLVVIGLCYAVSLLGLSTIISKIYGYDGYYALIVVVLPAFIWGIPKIKKLSAEKKAELSE